MAVEHVVRAEGCPDVVRHQPAADVAYQPGVDAHGWAVAPAEDIPPAMSAEDFRQVPIPLNIPLRNYPAQKPDFAKSDREWEQEQKARGEAQVKKPGIPVYNTDVTESWVQPGLVAVDTQEGKVMFNGKDVSAIAPAELNPDCIKQ